MKTTKEKAQIMMDWTRETGQFDQHKNGEWVDWITFNTTGQDPTFDWGTHDYRIRPTEPTKTFEDEIKDGLERMRKKHMAHYELKPQLTPEQQVIVDGFRQGKNLQFKLEDCWYDFRPGSFDIDSEKKFLNYITDPRRIDEKWRIKPEPNLRPMRPDEFPAVFWVENGLNSNEWELVTDFINGQFVGNNQIINLCDAPKHLRWSPHPYAKNPQINSFFAPQE